MLCPSTITSTTNNNEKRSLKSPVNERQEGVQEYWRTLMSKLEGMGAAAINLGWLGWSAAAGPVWLPSWMLLSTLQVTQASLTTKQPASAEKLAFVENRKIEVKWWHFGISQKSMILNHGLYTLYLVQLKIYKNVRIVIRLLCGVRWVMGDVLCVRSAGCL